MIFNYRELGIGISSLSNSWFPYIYWIMYISFLVYAFLFWWLSIEFAVLLELAWKSMFQNWKGSRLFVCKKKITYHLVFLTALFSKFRDYIFHCVWLSNDFAMLLDFYLSELKTSSYLYQEMPTCYLAWSLFTFLLLLLLLFILLLATFYTNITENVFPPHPRFCRECPRGANKNLLYNFIVVKL